MDRYHSLTTSAPALRSDNIPFAFALPARLGNPTSPSHQLLGRLTAPGTLTKLFRQLGKLSRRGGFYYPTGGNAATYLELLRDSRTREELLLFYSASPAGSAARILSSLLDFHSDEHLARTLAVVGMLYGVLKTRDAEVNKRLDQLVQERRKAQTLHNKLGKDYEEDTGRHVYMALAHLQEAINEYYAAKGSARNIARYIGWSLEVDFTIRAPGTVAKLVTNIFGVKPELTERQVRHLCDW
jgi:hypothetical protein